jgi:hypothetical protein
LRLSRIISADVKQKIVKPWVEDLEKTVDFICTAAPPFYKTIKKQNFSRTFSQEEQRKEDPTRP